MRLRPPLAFSLVLLLGLLVSPCAAADSAGDDFFEKQVRPLLVEKCQGCHGDKKSKGGLKLNSRASLLQGGELGPAVVPGNPDQSLLIKAVRYHDDLHMPPGGKLPDKQIALLEQWVKLGAPWSGATTALADSGRRFAITAKQRRFWSFRPVHAPPAPAVRNSAWLQSPIDPFILSALEAKHLAPAPPADKRMLLRRVTFDLIGLPPTPGEIEAFLKDNSPESFARVVDRLLASPQYGERWGRHWLDVVRYADARDLIQLPKESDFREAWRYRDWVVDSFNRDLPYTEFVRLQVAGDLIPSAQPGGFNADGLVATGLLAIADFVPGDVDKNQMIADYVNDQVDVVSRAFLGLSVACARCHDHKFDPISTEDYYALAGIFFSTRIIPAPVAGNTPLVKVPLLSPKLLARHAEQAATDGRRRAKLERSLTEAANNAYRESLKKMLSEQSARYLVAAAECRVGAKPASAAVAQRLGLQPALLAGWVALLDRVQKHPKLDYPTSLREFATNAPSGLAQAKAAALQVSLAHELKRAEQEVARAPERAALSRSLLLHFRADDPRIATDHAGRISSWPNTRGFSGDATPSTSQHAPVRAATKIGEHLKSVVRFDGQSVLAADRPVPPAGSLFAVFRPGTRPGERLVGWEDADRGQHGLGIMLDPGGRLHAILRKDGKSGDLVSQAKPTGFETVCLTWGPGGTIMRRNGVETSSPAIDGISSDPKIVALTIGGPGSGHSPRFSGDVADLRVYDRLLTAAERQRVEAELQHTWFQADDPKKPARDAVAELVDELLSPRGTFWSTPAGRAQLLGPDVQQRLNAMRTELDRLRGKPALVVPEAVVAQDGGPKGTRHEGFHDSHVFIRGDSKRLGKTVPRGFPNVLTGDAVVRITSGSGRLQLANWLIRADNPLTARLMVNRIWQHHFGEGLVRTPNDFGARGEPPTHPELLDYLAARFIESGWSVKALHRLILLSAVYQQSSAGPPDTVAGDPENRLLGHVNRQRLEAEALRDSLLSVSGRLDSSRGGMAFSDLATPRRTLYLMSARTGANTSGFGRLFDRADPSMIVAQRGQSIVAPQALFFLNDPFVTGIAHTLADRVRQEESPGSASRIRRLYALALGRPPTPAELELGTRLLAPGSSADGLDSLDRYCLLILSTNEFLYVD
jgi:hypothetical protein